MLQAANVLGEAKQGWTPYDLHRELVRFNPKRATPKPSGMRTLKNVVPYVGTRSVLFQFLSVGVTLPHMVYQQDMMFNDIEFVTDEEEAWKRNNLVEIRYKDNRVWMVKLDYRRNRVKVRCGCPSFYFEFSFHSWQKGGLFGSKPLQYIRKTVYRPDAPVGQRGYPPRNPLGVCSACKHCFNNFQMLQQKNWASRSTVLF